MAELNENFLVAWCGAKTDIGSGDLVDWEEYTTARDRYLEGHATPGSTGGSSAVHKHTGINHTHTGIAHTHQMSTGAPTFAISNENQIKPTTVASGTHTHTDDSPSATIDYGVHLPEAARDTNDCDPGDAQPLTCTVFWIKLKSTKTGDIPDGCCCFTDLASAPTGFELCDGDGSPTRPDMDERFLIGCASGDTVGGATQGATTHDHGTSPVHYHAPDDHDHPDGTIANCSSLGNRGTGWPSTIPASTAHTHAVTAFSSEALSATSYEAVTPNAASNDPDYTKLLAIINDSGGESTPVGVILPYTASGSLPSGWEECNGSDYSLNLVGEQIKGTVVGGSVGDTGDGGIDAHTHVDPGHGHTHTGGFHNHTFTLGACTSVDISSGGRATAGHMTHNHSSPTCGNATPTLQDAVATWNNTDAKYPWLTVRWVRYAGTGVTYKRAYDGTIAKTTKEVLAA